MYMSTSSTSYPIHRLTSKRVVQQFRFFLSQMCTLEGGVRLRPSLINSLILCFSSEGGRFRPLLEEKKRKKIRGFISDPRFSFSFFFWREGRFSTKKLMRNKELISDGLSCYNTIHS